MNTYPETNVVIAGLKNHGANVCYLNAVIQALASCHVFSQKFTTRIAETFGQNIDTPVFNSLRQILLTLQPQLITNRNPIKPQSVQPLLHALRTARRGSSLLLSHQEHDASEALELIFQSLEEEMHNAFNGNLRKLLEFKDALQSISGSPPACPLSSAYKAWIQDLRLPSQGLLAIHMQCIRCMHNFDIHYNPFTVLSLPLPLAATQQQPFFATINSVRNVKPSCNLATCLESLFGCELVTGVNCPRCSLRASSALAGGTLGSPALTSLFNSVDSKGPLPSEHSIQDIFNDALNSYLRYIPTKSEVARRSIVARWPPLLILHLRRSHWSATDGLDGPIKIMGHVKFTKQLRLKAEDGRIVTYGLEAVIVHQGLSSGTGHYITYRRVRNSGTPDHNNNDNNNNNNDDDDGTTSVWFQVSDESVQRVAERTVLSAHAVLLFYSNLFLPSSL